MKKNIILLITVLSVALLIYLIILNAFTYISSESIEPPPDFDGDGVPDSEDAFPEDKSQWYDRDNDGYGDNPDGLNPDAFPDDQNEWIDSDGDGVGDNSDAFPNDPTQWIDSDNDGYGDNPDGNNGDINPNVNLSIKFSINSFKVTRRVDLLKWAQVYFDVSLGVNNEIEERVDNNGLYWYVKLNELKDINYEISYEIPDNTKDKITKISVTMYDYDFFGEDDIIDINQVSGKKSLNLEFDNVENKIRYIESLDLVTNTIENNKIVEGFTKGSYGELYFSIIYPESLDISPETIDEAFSWKYGNKDWSLTSKIPVKTYEQYRNSTLNRAPQKDIRSYETMAAYVTSNERVIIDLALDLKDFADSKNYDKVTTANFILKFIQENIKYELDEDTKGCLEYWRFPVETLVDKVGDCEDTSVLYASIMKALGYDTVLFFYTWTNNDGQRIGHIAVGINLDGDHGSYILENGKKYYYCETTTIGYSVGKLPPDPTEIRGKPDKIIHV